MKLRIETVDAGSRLRVSMDPPKAGHRHSQAISEREVDDADTRFAIPRPSNRPPPLPSF
jgi:hypothetical protein